MTKEYRADIDGLRAIAIILVTVFHFDLLNIGKAGFIGVDVFFVISGFLITSIIVRELEAGTFSYGRFLYRRVRRLYPALIATLSLFLVFGSIFLLPDAFQELGYEAVLSQLYVVNFYFWRTVNYFGLHAANVPLLHMWSLAIEEQFYLIFPLVCLFVWRWRPKILPLVIGLGLFGSFLLGYFFTPIKPWASFYLLPTRAWELLAGAALALVLKTSFRPNRLVAQVLGPVGLFLVVYSVYAYTPVTQVPGTYALLPVTAAICLIAAGTHGDLPVPRLLSLRLVVWVGLISYPLYLVHWPILFLFRENLLEFTLPWRCLGFLLSYLLAWGIYRWVEQPIRLGQFLKSPRPFLISTGVLSSLLIAVSALALWQNGLPQRFDGQVAEILAFKEDEAFRFRHCENALTVQPATPCALGAKGSPDYLVFGDSHANAFAHAIDKWMTRTGKSGVFSFSHGCLPVRNLGAPKCIAEFNGALDYLQAHPEIQTVLMLSIWRQPYSGGMLHKGEWSPEGEIEAVFAEELRQSVADLNALGVRVVLVDPFYAGAGHVPRVMAKNVAFDRSWPTDKTLEKHLSEFALLYPAFDQVEGARRISLIDDFCASGECQAVYNGLPMFTDNNHIADAMSEPLSHIFEAEMSRIE